MAGEQRSGPQPNEKIQAEIKKRLIENGEWDRIQDSLTAYLRESGWLDDVKDLAKETARKQENPNLAALNQEVEPQAMEMVSAEVRRAVLQELEASLDRIVEKS